MDFFASCVEGMAQIWDLIVERKFNGGIARMVTSLDWCGLNKIIKFICNIDTPPNSLMDLTTSPKVKTTKGERVGTISLARNISGVKRCVGVSGRG